MYAIRSYYGLLPGRRASALDPGPATPGRLLGEYVPGSICFLAPGDLAWSSDLEILKKIGSGKDSETSLATVVAKFV